MRGRAEATAVEHWGTVAVSAWLLVGLFLDGWAHNLRKPDSFFTPWHGVIYSGFAAAALWVGSMALRRLEPGEGARRLLWAAPRGYRASLVGAAAFAAGGVADLAWHQAFGVEVDTAALVSPPHLVLFVSAVMVGTGPLRAAWSAPASGGERVGWRALGPALASLTFAASAAAFFLMNHSPFVSLPNFAFGERHRRLSADDRDWLLSVDQADFLLTTAVFVGPALLLLRRWGRPPRGSITVLWGVMAGLLAAIDGFSAPEPIAAALAAGLLADVALWRLPAGAGVAWRRRLFGFALPAVLWLCWFAVVALRWGVALEVEAWTGIVTTSSLLGGGLALLVWPPGAGGDGGGDGPAERLGSRRDDSAGGAVWDDSTARWR
ncbi:MAG: hypothetical protein ACKVWR_01305 [Acidimicrobiales bacterium]